MLFLASFTAASSEKNTDFNSIFKITKSELKIRFDISDNGIGISEDDIKRDLDALQKHTDDFTKQIADIAVSKEKEVREG